MADDEDYQILPQRDFFALKKQVEELSGNSSPKKLMEAMEDLTKTLTEMIELFKATSQELKRDEKEEANTNKKLDKLMSQQKVMAEAILAISEKIGMHHDAPHEMAEQSQQPPMPSMPPLSPSPQFSPQFSSGQTMPPPLPGMQQAMSGMAQGNPSMPPLGQPMGQPFGQPEPFTPRPFGGFGQPDARQPFGMQRTQAPPFEPPEFAPTLNQMPQPGQSFGSNPMGGPSPDFPDLGNMDNRQEKKKGFFGFRK